MIKRILVATDGSDAATRGIRYAAAVAQKCRASILGLFVVDVKLLEGPFLRDLSASLGTAPYVNYQGNIAMVLEERGKAALDDLQRICEQANVPCETTQTTGLVSRTIVEHGELTDIIILGRGGEHSEWLEGLGSTAEAVIRRARQPVLVTGTDELRTRRLVVAYDDTQHAREALKRAAMIAAEWHMDLQAIIVGGEETQQMAEEAAKYLQSYEFQFDIVVKEGDPGEVIVAHVTEGDADLLVMGAYGHSKVRDLVVGSTCTYVLNHAPCPVLLTQ